jgi:hypothetical protein
MQGINQSLAFWLIVWLLAVFLMVYGQWRRKSVRAGLVLAHVANMWMIHWFAAALYLLPWHLPLVDPGVLVLGLEQATYGTLAFAAGNLLVAPLIIKRWQIAPAHGETLFHDERVPNVYILFGLFTYFVLTPVLGRLPSMAALLSGGWNLFLLGLIIKCWHSWHAKQWGRFYFWVGLAVVQPVITLVLQGFLGYGMVALMTVLAVVATFYRPRWRIVLAGSFAVYLFLSVYVTYMRDRNQIRASVWGGESMSQRFDVISNSFFNPELFNIYDERHLWRVDTRLNQSSLIGPAVVFIGSGERDFAYGSTLVDAVLALIPRAIWWNKPIVAGSGNLVSNYTGIQFAEGTSVGVGQVMEFYINFGTAGVIGGFLFIGVVITLLDAAAGQRLRERDWKAAALWFLPGLALLQVGGSLVEVMGASAGSAVMAWFVSRYVAPRVRGRQSTVLEVLAAKKRLATPQP